MEFTEASVGDFALRHLKHWYEEPKHTGFTEIFNSAGFAFKGVFPLKPGERKKLLEGREGNAIFSKILEVSSDSF